MRSATPNLAIAASVSPPPAIENAFDRAMASASARVPAANASNSNTPTGPFQTIVPAPRDRWPQHRDGLRADVEDQVVVCDVVDRLDRGRRVGGERLGAHDVDRERHLAAGIRRGSRALRRTRSGSASDLPMRPPAASDERVRDAAADDQRVDLRASARRIVSLVDTFEPATIATSGRCGLRERLAERVELRRPAAGRRRRPARNAPCRASSLRRDARCRRRRCSRRRRACAILLRERVVVLLLALD